MLYLSSARICRKLAYLGCFFPQDAGSSEMIAMLRNQVYDRDHTIQELIEKLEHQTKPADNSGLQFTQDKESTSLSNHMLILKANQGTAEFQYAIKERAQFYVMQTRQPFPDEVSVIHPLVSMSKRSSILSLQA